MTPRAFPVLAPPDLAVPYLEAALARLEARRDPEACRAAEAELLRLEAVAASSGGLLPLPELRRRYALDEVEATLLLAAARPQLRHADRHRLLGVGELVEACWDDPVERAAALDRLAVHARLRRHRLLDLWTVSPHLGEHFLAQQVLAPPRVAAYLQGRLDLGTGLHQAARLLLPEASPPAAPWTETPDAALLRALLERWLEREPPERLAVGLCGDAGCGKSWTVRHLARTLGRPLVELDASFLEVLDARTAV